MCLHDLQQQAAAKWRNSQLGCVPGNAWFIFKAVMEKSSSAAAGHKVMDVKLTWRRPRVRNGLDQFTQRLPAVLFFVNFNTSILFVYQTHHPGLFAKMK